MIIWANCKITDVRLVQYSRYHLRNDNRFDVAKYTFSSYAPLEPLVSKFVFNLTMADGFAGCESEMETWLKSCFPADKLDIRWSRRDHIDDWKDLLNEYPDELIFITGTEDHVFMDSNIDVFTKGIDILNNDTSIYSILNTMHYPEAMRCAGIFDGSFVNDWIKYTRVANDSMRIVHRKLINEQIRYYEQGVPNKDLIFFRPEDVQKIGHCPAYVHYSPTKEQFCHFDGYSHVNIGPDVSPPLEIPPKFFEGAMTIRYGFNDRDPECVNINPLSSKLYAADVNGADYKFCLEDIPAFWKNRIKEIKIADGIDHTSAKQARNIFELSKTNLPMSGYWDGFRQPKDLPIEWFSRHFINPDL